MHKRALKIVKTSQSTRGVPVDQIIKPKTLVHFHINAIDDKIDFNKYKQSQLNAF